MQFQSILNPPPWLRKTLGALSLLIIFSTSARSSIFETHAMAGKDAYEKENRGTAKQELEMAIRTWTPGDGTEEKAAVYSMLGLIDMAEQHYDHAIENFDQVIKLNSNQGHPHFRIALIYSAQDKNELAIAELKKDLKEEPDFFMAQRTLGDLYKKNRQHELAIQCYVKATALNPQSDSAYAGLGDCYRMMDKYSSATTCLETAVKLNHNNAIAYYNLGLCYSSLKLYNKAISDYQNALTAHVITMSAFKVEVFTYLGEAYEKTGQAEKAKQAYKQAKDILDAIPYTPEKSSTTK